MQLPFVRKKHNTRLSATESFMIRILDRLIHSIHHEPAMWEFQEVAFEHKLVFQHKHKDTLIHGETHVEIRKDGRVITLPRHLEAHGTVQRYRELVKSRICTLQTAITTAISEKTHGNLAIASS